MAIIASLNEDGSLNSNGAMYSLPINATPESEAAFEISMIQLMPNAIEG